MTAILAVVLAAGPLPAQVCASRSAPALDHVVVVVRDLDAASAGFREHGFRLKNGRLHSNNLLNRHIKFRDGSSIELMTVQGEPGDAMARRYTDLLAAGEGGVYVALSVSRMEVVQAVVTTARLEHHRSSSGPWQFLGFPPASPAAAVFFSAGGVPAQDPDSLLAHAPLVHGLKEVWLEGGEALIEMLVRLGAVRCGIVQTDAGHAGERLGLSRGTIVVVPQRADVRPRVLGVTLRSGSDSVARVRPHRRFWLRYESGGPG